MPPAKIVISIPKLPSTEVTILRRYLTESHRFLGSEWQILRQAMAKLKEATIQFGDHSYRFAQFYRTFINGAYAYPFIDLLSKLPNLQQDGVRTQAQVARQIYQWLHTNGIQAGVVQNAEYLITFCLAEWGAFARGYIFEAIILRDLRKVGIEANPHNPITERFTPYDLQIAGLGYGDIKSSGYFLDDFVDGTPMVDFYITRIYVPNEKQHHFVVFLMPLAWNRLSRGEYAQPLPKVTSLAQATIHFPRPVWLQIESLDWIIIDYHKWQELVLQRQKEGKDHE